MKIIILKCALTAALGRVESWEARKAGPVHGTSYFYDQLVGHLIYHVIFTLKQFLLIFCNRMSILMKKKNEMLCRASG